MRKKSLYDKLSDKLFIRFAFKKRDGKAIARELILALQEIISESDEIRIPYLGRFKVRQTSVKQQPRYSLKLKKYVNTPIIRFNITFKAAPDLRMKIKMRKMGAVSNIQLELQNEIDSK